jgi:hypothetical protein
MCCCLPGLHSELNHIARSQADAQLLLPLAHKYNFGAVMSECQEYLCSADLQFFSPDAGSSGYILTWLQLSDRLQLDMLRTTCLRYIQDEVIGSGMTSILSNEQQLATMLTPETLAKLVHLLASSPSHHGVGMVQCSKCHLDVWPAAYRWTKVLINGKCQ